MEFNKEKQEVAYWMRRLYEQNLTSCSGGNVSMRTEDGHILITPSQIDKARIEAKDICVISPVWKNLTPDLKPSMETSLHMAVYQSNSNIKAIIHAHPPKASAWACSENSLMNNLTGEARYILGKIAKAKYEIMGSVKLASEAAKHTENHNVVLLANHGALCAGENLFQAFDRMEVLEHLAEMSMYVKIIKKKQVLSAALLKDIDNL
ncbi:MAG: class II aldolase/adducin family protein [Bacteroidales bacterium]|nr:class II aldolase/adducin family protein [Bacteroidales bacterium]MDD4234805.1 class II aldolase/adducin family protein [Bacteroidales bacterium]